LLLIADKNSSDSKNEQYIATFVEPPEDPASHSGTTYWINASQTFEQSGYRISCAGWFPPPPPITPSILETPENTGSMDKATIRIENIATGKVDYLYIQFMPNGEIISEVIR